VFYPSSGDIRVAVTDRIATVTLDRAERRNAVTLAMWRELAEIFHRFGEDDAVRVMVLTGAGANFCSGADIGEFAQLRGNAEAGAAYNRAVDACSDAISGLAKPTLAAIGGFCLGGGVGLAIACDFRFAAPDSVFAVPASRLGIVYGLRETQNLLALVGLSHAKRILFSGERFDAAEALRIGFIDRLGEDPLAEAQGFAAVLADNAPLSIAGAKLVLSGFSQGFGALDRAAAEELAQRALDSEDYREGQRAFAEKRKPNFTGR
jgi:enoyl-CoA hydratase/carnithine racemase